MSDAVSRLNAALEGRYRIERELGAGGMATVYLAHDAKHNRNVALKVLKPELAAVVGAERFLAEIETTANLQHPHILPLFDSGQVDGFLFYVMPYVEGETLRRRLDRERQLPVDEAVRIATKVAGALQAAHDRGVIHRDVKPANILMAGGEPLVADFGIALAVSAAGGGRLTETGLSLGTPYYMSPEQATADRDPDARSDVYSLACVLYEMLAGEPPHTGSTAQAVLARILTEMPRPVRGVRNSVPEHIDAALEQALEKLPADRFATAADFAVALGNAGFVRPGAAVARASAGGARRAASPARRVPVTRTATVAVVVALVAGALAGRATAPEPQPRAPTRWILRPDSTHVVTGRSVAISPDGRTVLYRGFEVLGGLGLYARDLGDLAPLRLPGNLDWPSAFFSPDGAWIAGFRFARDAAGSTLVLEKAPSQGGAAIEVARVQGSGPGGGTWSENGAIYFTDREGGLHQVSSEGGVAQPVTVTGASESTRYFLPQHLPGRGALLLHYGSDPVDEDGLRMGLLSLTDGTLTDLGPGLYPRLARDVLVHVDPSRQLVARRFDARTGRFVGGAVAMGVTLLLDRGVAPFAVADNGTLVYTRDMVAQAAAVVTRAGSDDRILRLPIESVNHFDSPRMSPDGRRLAIVASVSTGHQPYVVDLEAGTALRLTTEPGVEYLQWTPEGDSIAYVDERGDLVLRAADRAGEPRLIVSSSTAPIQRLSVGRDWVVYSTAEADRRGAIRFLPRMADGETGPSTYLDTPADEYAPALSPDGDWLAYVSDEDGHPEVFVRAFPQPSGPRVVSSGGGVNPIWHPDGRSLYYRGLGREVIRAHVDYDRGFSVSARDTVLEGSWEIGERSTDYDVLPDGSGLVVLGLRQELDGLVVIVDALSEIAGSR